MLINRVLLISSFCALNLLMQSCCIDCDEGYEEPSEYTYTYEKTYSPPREKPSDFYEQDNSQYLSDWESCLDDDPSTNPKNEALMCKDNGERSWLMNCKGRECSKVNVNIHYLLTDEGPIDIGSFITVEAFDNPYFRAYSTNKEVSPRPYQLHELELISDQPTGVYGTLSKVAMVNVKSRSQGQDVDIYLDQIFSENQGDESTEARIRFLVSVSDGL